MKHNRSFAAFTGVFFVALLAIPSGCRPKDGGTDVLTLQGQIEKVDPNPADPNTGRITVAYQTEKQPGKRIGHGSVTRETEIVIDGETGRLAPAGDDQALAGCLIALAEDTALMSRFGTQGSERAVELFSEEEMHRQYQELYDGMAVITTSSKQPQKVTAIS